MILNANHWEDYVAYISKIRREKEAKEKRIVKKKEKERAIDRHNSSVKSISKQYATEMQNCPSELEIRMKQFLDNQGITYDFQRVFNIKDRDGRIKKFFIADFYVPSRNLVIETDGKFHDEQSDYDEIRTQILQHFYPNIRVIRWRWYDFQSLKKLKELTALLKGK